MIDKERKKYMINSSAWKIYWWNSAVRNARLFRILPMVNFEHILISLLFFLFFFYPVVAACWPWGIPAWMGKLPWSFLGKRPLAPTAWQWASFCSSHPSPSTPSPPSHLVKSRLISWTDDDDANVDKVSYLCFHNCPHCSRPRFCRVSCPCDRSWASGDISLVHQHWPHTGSGQWARFHHNRRLDCKSR